MMKDKISEQVSALYDDELNQSEHELLLRRLKQEADLQDALLRYQIIGDAIRHNLDAAASTSLASAVSNRIELEDNISIASNSKKSSRILKPVAGLAIAASVAAMAVIGLQDVGDFQGVQPAPQRVVQVQPQTPVNVLPVASGTHWDKQQPETERRLNGYLVNHSEYTSSISLQGMINYARIAGYDSKNAQSNK